jgi:hypothetical protein
MVDEHRQLRAFVRNWFESYSYQLVHQNRFLAARVTGQKLYCEELKLESLTIYGTDLKADFAVFNPSCNKLLFIECMWQAGSGTTDEKFPYKEANIRERFPDESITIMLVDGGGFRAGGIAWLEDQRTEKLVEVVNRNGFQHAMVRQGFA